MRLSPALLVAPHAQDTRQCHTFAAPMRAHSPCRPPVRRLPRGFNKGRRSQVMSAPVELTAGWQPPVFSKTSEEKAALRQLLSMHVLFSELPSNDIEVPLHSPSPSPSPLNLTP